MNNLTGFRALFLTIIFCLAIFVCPVYSQNTKTYEENTAIYYMSKGKYDKALEWYEKFMKKYPTYISYKNYYECGQLYEKNKKYDEALNYYFMALEKNNNIYLKNTTTNVIYDTREPTMTAISRMAETQNNMDLWLKSLNIAIGQTPNDAKFYPKLADYYIDNNQVEKALNISKKLLELAPGSVDSFNELAICYYLVGDYGKSLLAIDKALTVQPNNKRALVYKSFVYFDKGDYNQTIKISKNLLKDLNHNVYRYRVLIRLALSYLFIGRTDDALAVALEAYDLRNNRLSGLVIETGASHPVVKEVGGLTESANAGILSGDTIESVDGVSTLNKSIAEIKKLIAGKSDTPITMEVKINSRAPLKPKVTVSSDYNAIKVLRKNNYKKLLPITFKRSNYFGGSSTDSVGLVSLIYREKGNNNLQIDNANSAYALYNNLCKTGKRALEINSNKIVYNVFLAQYPMAIIEIDNGNYIKALEILDKLETTPDLYIDFLTLIKINKALAYQKLAKNKEALNILQDLAVDGFNSENVYLKQKYQDLLISFSVLKQELYSLQDELEKDKDYQAALENLTKLISLAENKDELNNLRSKMFYLGKNVIIPDDINDEIHKYSLRGEILLKEKDYKGALKEFKKVLKIAPYLTSIYYNTALVLGELKQYNEAMDYMNIYIEAEPTALDIQQAKDEIIKWELKLEKEKKII